MIFRLARVRRRKVSARPHHADLGGVSRPQEGRLSPARVGSEMARVVRFGCPTMVVMPDLFIERAGRLVPMTDLPFTSEDIFQALLGRHPALLEGDLLTPDREQRRFLLVCGMPVPDSEGGGGRWSSDHLFLDQDGIHTMVEIKRSSDTRIGREVIGRVLDYAANATALDFRTLT